MAYCFGPMYLLLGVSYFIGYRRRRLHGASPGSGQHSQGGRSLRIPAALLSDGRGWREAVLQKCTKRSVLSAETLLLNLSGNVDCWRKTIYND